MGVFHRRPVRFAPTTDNGRVYAGSDDGTAYCLDAATGKLIWNHTAASEKNVLVPNDGRLVSPGACAARSPWTAARLFSPPVFFRTRAST